MAVSFKDNSALWDDFYHGHCTQRLGELGFPAFSSTKIVLKERPSELQDLQGKIDTFWQNYNAANEGARNGKLYALSGWDDFEYGRGTLMVRAYETNFATLLVKTSKEGLTSKEAEFLDKKVMFLGSGGYIQNDNKYLVGKVAKRNVKQDLWESVPQGFVSYGFHHHEDPFRKTLEKEGKEETALDVAFDFEIVRPYGINLGPRAGNCTIIYHLQLRSSSLEKIKCSSEHLDLRWATLGEVLDPAQRYAWTPITRRLFEKIAEEK